MGYTASLFWVVTLGLILALPGIGGAETDESVTMETVVVTATRSEQQVTRVPANVSVIDEEDIRQSNAKTVVDLLRYEEGVVVRDLLGNGKGAQVDLRGYGESGPLNTLVLVDGRRVNGIDISAVDWNQIPLDQVQRIEIVRGTGTVLFGDNAVGGVINIITKPAPSTFTASGAATFGSYGRNAARASVGGGSPDGTLAASFYGNYDATNGYRENNEFRAKDAGGKIVYTPTEAIRLNLSGSYHSDDAGLPGPLPENLADSDPTSTLYPLDEAETWDKYAKLGLDWDLGTWGRIVADMAYRDRDNDSRFPDTLFPFATESVTQTWSLTPRYIWDGEILGLRNNVIVGVDLYKSDQDLDSFSGFFSPIASLSGVSEIERDSVGYYFNDEIAILQNLFFTAGIRRERVEYDLLQVDLSGFFAPLDDQVSDWETGYVGGIVYQYHGKSSVFGRANRSFRFPLTDELVVFDFPNSRIQVNPDIRPQTGRHYEVGVRHFFTPEIQANLTLFRAEIKDEIFFNPATFTNENYPETLHQGVELGAEARVWDRLALFGNYTYEKAKFEKGPFDGNDIPAVPRHKGNVGVRIYNMVPGLVFSALYNYVGPSYLISDLANQFDKLDSWYTVDLKLSYDWKWLSAFAGVNNLTDEEYSSYGVVGGGGTTPFFYPAPDRNWVAGVEVRY